MGNTYRGYRDLKVYQLSFATALELFDSPKSFPSEEKYSLTDQIRRCSRSVPANFAEAWRRRIYPKAFVSKLIDCLSEASEVEVWLDFYKDHKYIDSNKHEYFLNKYEEIQKMLYSMVERPEKFCR